MLLGFIWKGGEVRDHHTIHEAIPRGTPRPTRMKGLPGLRPGRPNGGSDIVSGQWPLYHRFKRRFKMFWLFDKLVAILEKVMGVVFVKQGDELYR